MVPPIRQGSFEARLNSQQQRKREIEEERKSKLMGRLIEKYNKIEEMERQRIEEKLQRQMILIE